MDIIHITPSIAEKLSGPSYSVVNLCKNLKKFTDLSLFTLSNSTYTHSKNESIIDDSQFIEYFQIGAGPKKLGRCPLMMKELKKRSLLNERLIIHNHGTWHMTAIYPSRLTGKNIKIINSPRGTLSTNAIKSGSKFKLVFWQLLLKQSFKKSFCFHATSENEYHDIRKQGFKQPVAIIPNGVDLPVINALKNKNDAKVLLYIGRIHKSKGIEDLLKSWQKVMMEFNNWELHIVGTDKLYNSKSSYLEELKIMTNNLGLERVKFVDPLFDNQKVKKYQEASITILPSYFESFGMTVAESLSNSTPVITTNKTPWKNLEIKKSGWCIDIGEESISECLRQVLIKNEKELEEIGKNGRQWMSSEYSWQSISKMTYETYLWMLNMNNKPEWVKND